MHRFAVFAAFLCFATACFPTSHQPLCDGSALNVTLQAEEFGTPCGWCGPNANASATLTNTCTGTAVLESSSNCLIDRWEVEAWDGTLQSYPEVCNGAPADIVFTQSEVRWVAGPWLQPEIEGGHLVSAVLGDGQVIDGLVLQLELD